MKKWVLLLLLLFSAFPSALSAEESSTSKQVALEIYPKWYSSDNMTIQGNIGVRKLFQEHDWITSYVKPSMTYALSHHIALHGGLGFSYTNNKTVNNVEELRPFLGLSHFTNFSDKWAISSYFRSEERYFYTVGSDNRSQTTRLRLRFRNSYKLNALNVPHSWHKVTFDLEGFKSLNSEITVSPVYDYETRVTLGAEHSLSEQKKVRFELAWKYKTQAAQISDADIHTIFFKIQYFPSWGSRFRNRLRDRDIDE
jgi:hypothetical protein